MPDITIVILTKNEIKNIETVIKNSQLLTNEVLIIDSGSTDGTVEKATALGAKVKFRAWDNDFSAQRNFALKHVKTKWILYLDADEIMSGELITSIKATIEQDDLKQCTIIRKIRAFGFEYKYGIFKPDKVTRLFPTNSMHWEHKVHERPVCALPNQVLNGFIEHYTYSNWQQWWEKAGRYTTIWAEDQYANGKRVSISAPFTHGISALFKAYFIQLGFLDGWSGIYSTYQHIAYTVMKYLKLYELQAKNSK